MPTMTAIEIPAADVTLRDILTHNAVSHTVTNVDRKPVWIYISFEGGTKPLRINRDDVVTVERMVETEEEKAIKIREYTNASIKRSIDRAEIDFAEAVAKIANDPSHWNIEKLISARRAQELFALVVRVAEHEEIDYAAAREYVVDRESKDLLNFTASSQSTSVVSNAVDAVRFDVTAKFCRNGLLGW